MLSPIEKGGQAKFELVTDFGLQDYFWAQSYQHPRRILKARFGFCDSGQCLMELMAWCQLQRRRGGLESCQK